MVLGGEGGGAYKVWHIRPPSKSEVSAFSGVGSEP